MRALRTRLAAPGSLLVAGLLGWWLAASPAPAGAQARPAARILDSFERVEAWSAHPAGAISLRIGQDPGRRGRAMRLDFDFHGGGGYAIARRSLALALPENYAFSFWLRADAPVNNFEFKLIDSTGQNVWWKNQRDYHFPAQWQRVTIERRQIRFGWGPVGGGDLKHLATIELVVTAGTGGKGTVWIDDLTLTPLEPVRPEALTPVVRASSAQIGQGPARALDGDSTTAWQSGGGGPQWLTIDFQRLREYGGLVIDWVPGLRAPDYVVETGADGVAWKAAHRVRGGAGARDFIYLPETESRYLRLRLLPGARPGKYAIRGITVEPVKWSESPNDFFRAVAKDAPRGSYPRYFSDEQSYWTVIGVDGDAREGLINEEGMIEAGKGEFSVEPFLYAGGKLITWNDAGRRPSLEQGYLPIPSVQWTAGNLSLTVTAYAGGPPGASSLFARYRVRNAGAEPAHATLFLALRPFQVSPPWQYPNRPGGVTPIREIGTEGGVILVNGARAVVPLTRPAGFGAATFDQGGIIGFLRQGTLPPLARAAGSLGFEAGAIAYPLDLPAGAEREVFVQMPLHRSAEAPPRFANDAAADEYGKQAFDRSVREWTSLVGRVPIDLPPAAAPVVETLKSTLAYILINRDGAAIQPGSRTYERSWIRDGALTAAALLRLGHTEVVRQFIEWYAPYQSPNGKIPCCVDARGADPTPEHDSNGEFLFLVAEYYRYSGDRALLERLWPRLVKVVAYLDSLRHERMTLVYRTGDSLPYFGLLPPSISHEGYSPAAYSYWDDFFALKGLKDAAEMAAALGRGADRDRFAAIRDEFRRDLYQSLRLAMARHAIDYLPGSANLGDFDATSTTTSMAPGGELANLPADALRRTFEKQYERFRARRDGAPEQPSYVPYELRVIGTFVRLGWRARAQELLEGFFADRRPPAWNQWAEVVWPDPATPKFIGDMPHTWVGSDFIRSLLDMFAYERESDSSLVIGAGIPLVWVTSAPGVAVHGLATAYGPLSFSMTADGDTVRVRIEEGIKVPPGGIVVTSPFESGRDVTVTRLPAEITFRRD